MLQVQVIKDDLKTARAVSIPSSPVAAGAARLQLKLFGLSANNIITRQWAMAPLDTGTSSHRRPVEREQVLFRPVFGAGWWLADFVHRGSSHTVVMSSATSKSALVTARQLRRLGKQHLVGLTSAKNTSYLRDTALYHQMLSYDDVASVTTEGTAMYVDFLGRASLTSKVHEVIGDHLIRSVMFGATDWADKPGGVQPPKGVVKGPVPEFFFTPSYYVARLAEVPALRAAMQRDIQEFYPSSRRFVTIHNRRGVDEIISCWMRLLSGDISPREGLTLQF